MLRLLLVCTLLVLSTFAQTPPRAPVQQQQQSYELTPERRQKAIDYSRAQYRLTFFGIAYGLLQLGIVLALRIAPRFRTIAERVSSRRVIQAFIFVPLLLIVLSLFDLPVDLYRHSLALQYEQSVQGWGSWTWDQVKGLALSFVFSSLGILLLYAVIRKSPRRWWLVFWLFSLPIIALTIWLVPVLIEPLFFKFVPLNKTQPALVKAIEQVVQRGGLTIPEDRMFEMKASEKLKSVNAYVTGFGSSKRVVVWDTTIQKMTTAETLFVFGHEMGHYVLNHIYKGLVFSAASLLLSLWLAYLGLRWLVERYGSRFEIRGVDDWASFPFVLLLFSIFGFVSQPINNSFSRYQEHQADIYGLEVTHGLISNPAQTAAHAFQILGEVNLSDPDPSPFIQTWLYSHPPIPQRIVFAQQYDPWSRNQPRQFVP